MASAAVCKPMGASVRAGARPHASPKLAARLGFKAGGVQAAIRPRPAGLVGAARQQQQRQQQQWQQPQRRGLAVAAASGADSELVTDGEFAISKISFGSILTPLGVGLLVYGFGAYFLLLPGADISSLLLIYGFPISVLGFALSYAQLAPVPCKTTKAAFELRATQMTDIQKQVREDVTRYRYGDEAHLEEAIDKIWRFGKSGGLPRKSAPVLVGVREETSEGRYTLVLEFESKLDWAKWEEKQAKFQSFFGPGIEARLAQTERGVDVLLVSDGSGSGRGGGEQKDVLPPLMPGLPARQQ
ncbi:hypothetical protein Rsub_12350 [Raphidocelis subcapitata]|uniref:Thylakoid membrane protein n=1 Tax=Raphidocelis subcapitata TaxID=307507 RepID=A0A2V0PID8_9CHLO|nr:hypothetical protein Rsub_12350 [Raphidocelis subcapitata]|eukprot:GBF99544.1 hypothetical protein Rsub_12350 [Raphidocelis subcapitata]